MTFWTLFFTTSFIACGDKSEEEAAIVDADGDGFTVGDGDCDDGNNTIYPGAEDQFYDGVDQNCDGANDYDADGDGFVPAEYEADAGLPGGDCWDSTIEDTIPEGFEAQNDFEALTAADVYPGAEDRHYDAIDQDCSGDEYEFDADQDGDGSARYGAGGDCVDNSDELNDVESADFSPADIHSFVEENWYDGVDQDCLGNDDFDQDGDGYVSDQYGGTDCDDTEPTVNPGAVDYWYDGVDQDCDGQFDYDQDNDGEASVWYGGDDCNDQDSLINSTVSEIWYDGVDQNCDGLDDFDQDQDGHSA